MSDFIRRRVEAYVERVRTEATIPYADGKLQLVPDALRAIVHDEPREVTELVVRVQALGYREGSADRLQVALVLARSYHQEFGDGRLVELVRNTARGEPIPYDVTTPDGDYQPEEEHLGPPLAFRAIRIENDDPQDEGFLNLVRIFGEIERQPVKARVLRGLVSLNFPRYDDDPRPYFAVPGVRACIAALDERFPYFLYYIVPTAQAGQVMSYANSLLSMELFEFLPSIWRYTGTVEDLLDLLIPRMYAIRRFCGMTGDNPDEVTGTVLQNYPESLASAISTAFRSTDEL